MKTLRLWIIIFIIIIGWIYYFFISPKITNNKIITIPDIVKMSETEGVEVLKENNILYNITYIDNDEEIVIKTIPFPNTKIKSNFYISVYVGKIAPITYISNLGQIWEEVKTDVELFCNNNRIKLKLVYEQNNDVVDGIIIKESLTNKQSIEGIEELIITIATNNTKLVMPNFVGCHINEVIEFIDKYNLSLVFIYLEVLMTEDIVLYQSVLPNTIIDKNNKYKIEIYVSKIIT